MLWIALTVARLALSCLYNRRMTQDLHSIENFVKQTPHDDSDLVETVRSAISRANGNQGHNTYISLDETWTITQVEQQRRHFSQIVEKPLLYGLPIALKDCFDLAGFHTTSGSKFYAERREIKSQDSAVAARLKQQGAIIVGKTTLHQLAYGITGENPDYGDCLQPGDATRLTGGSSSGSAAALLEGSALASIGTDTGGSIRVPAALCGLAGYRSSLGLGDWHGGDHLAPTFDTIGWLYRNLSDSVRLGRALFDLPANPSLRNPVRIAYLADGTLDACDTEVMTAFETWKERLRSTGATLIACHPTFFRGACSIYAPIQAHEAAKLHAGFYDHFDPVIADRLRWGASLGQGEIQQWRAKHREFIAQCNALFAEFDFLLMPATPVARLNVGVDHSSSRMRILAYTTPASLAGWPAVVLPFSPCGVQLLARHSHDEQLLSFVTSIQAEV